ncbi:hypothetical protein D9757_005707 [Collybiopsis confluens]|uniref:GAR domain-containing protein n=1 Tax=Collybiopsis confluens TaxID=2823264 RepID=A0A8H5HPR7_9AGAR|nr:hypothetical protein D9757_005707 [Collybiopsis confluens]
MPSLSLSPSSNSLASIGSTGIYAPPSPQSVSSASSSRMSLDQQDEENVTITARRLPQRKPSHEEDLRLLAISTHMTELSYMISDIQTRIFEIQELRHKSQSTGDAARTTSIIDQSLMTLDEKLESVSKGIKSINDSLDPFLQATPTVPQTAQSNTETKAILRKHATLVSEWEAVQEESEVLREELKEDKWLTVFRTVTDQADGMMSSLEKGVNRCQEFIWQVHRRGIEDTMSHSQISLSQRSEKPPPTLETFNTLLDSFEAKKKHYMPATSKVLAIIDKGVRDRVTKNGETLRRHAESAQRWKNLRERITRTDAEMETVRHILTRGDAGSDHGSIASTQNGYLATPPSGSRNSRAPSSASTISRSISPFRKFARKITGNSRSPISPVTPLSIHKGLGSEDAARNPSSEPTLRRQKTSLFSTLRGPTTPITPDRPSHKYSQSLTPDSSPRNPRVELTLKSGTPSKPTWNSSTKVERDGTIKATPPKRAPSAAGVYDNSSLNGAYRSLSRTSMASSRPWSPVTSSVSTNQSSTYPPLPTFRPPSRAQTPSRNRARTPGMTTATPRTRPKTPSYIPAPYDRLKSFPSKSEAGWDDDESVSARAFSPTQSVTSTPSRAQNVHPPRPPSRSMIPVPTVHLSSPSRPGSSMSLRARSESPTLTFKALAARSQTPESALKARAQQVPVYQGTLGRSTIRPSLPPSSFRDGSVAGSRVPSRSISRSGAYTPSGDNKSLPPLLPVHEYLIGNYKDPLDVELAYIVNSIAHGFLIERVDPPLKKIPGGNEEIKAQYAFSNALSRKVITCKLTTLTRSGKGVNKSALTTKKVMCRVGGGWQDLSHYILNRQAGM